MTRALLVGGEGHAWRTWREGCGMEGPVVSLDPSYMEHGWGGRLMRTRGEQVLDWRFIGTLKATRNPLSVISGAMQLASDDAIVLLSRLESSPLARHFALTLAQLLQPQAICTAAGTGMENWPWPIGAEPVELEDSPPEIVLRAQERAQWLHLLRECHEHEIDLEETPVIGARLGSSERLQPQNIEGWLEVCGGGMLWVSDQVGEDTKVDQAMHFAEASKVWTALPSHYGGLLCAMSQEDGSEQGMGIVESFDPNLGRMKILCTAEPGTKPQVLKLGTLRLQKDGKRAGEAPPWTV